MGNKSQSRRADGEGSIYQTPKGLWRRAVMYTDPATGKPVRKYVQSMKKAEVQRQFAELRRELDLGHSPDAGKETLGHYLDRWLQGMMLTVKPSSWRHLEVAVRVHLKPRLGHKPLRALSPFDVERVTSSLTKAGHPAMARNVRAILRKALNDAAVHGLVTRNSAAMSKAPASKHDKRPTLNKAQVTALVEGTADDEFGPLFALLVRTGVRVGEALALVWDDLDSEHATLAVEHTLSKDWSGVYERATSKTKNSARTIPLSASPMSALRRQRTLQKRQRLAAGSAWEDNGFVFTNTIGGSLRDWTVNKRLHGALKRLGLPDVSVHGLRHTCARLMRENGASIEAISTYFGHSSIAITADLYAHLGDPQRREAAEAMERANGEG